MPFIRLYNAHRILPEFKLCLAKQLCKLLMNHRLIKINLSGVREGEKAIDFSVTEIDDEGTYYPMSSPPTDLARLKGDCRVACPSSCHTALA